MSIGDKLARILARLGTEVSTEETKVFEYRSVKVWMGKEERDSVHGREALREIAGQLGLSEAEIGDMLGTEGGERILAELTERLHADGAAEEASGPIRRVECPECARTVVDRKGFCVYCGAVLHRDELRSAEGATASTERHEVRGSAADNDVDARFLSPDEHGDTAEGQDETDARQRAFLRRLTQM